MWNELVRQKNFQIAVSAVLGTASGATVCYIVVAKRLEAKYEDLANREITEARDFYARRYKRGTFATPEDAAAELIPNPAADAAVSALTLYQGGDDDEEDSPPEESSSNIFDVEEFEWDQEVEESKRTGQPIYVIHHDEYMGSDLPQQTLTYYGGDNTLADEKEEHIPDHVPIVGDALDRFGHGSGDPNTVFVRNERLRLDFEIVMSDGKYAHEVLGLQHSADDLSSRTQSRKLRVDDD